MAAGDLPGSTQVQDTGPCFTKRVLVTIPLVLQGSPESVMTENNSLVQSCTSLIITCIYSVCVRYVGTHAHATALMWKLEVLVSLLSF